MKRILIKIVVLAVVFVGSVYAFSIMINSGEVQNTKTVDDPTLPVLMMRYDGTEINCMYGYASEMDETTLRSSVTLLPYDRVLTVSVRPYEARIRGIDYRVSSLEDGHVIEDGRVKSFTTEGEYSYADFHLEDPISMGQEYMLRFDVLLENGRTYYYYTRIVQRNGQNLNWYLDYTDAFYHNCIQNNVTEEMTTQLEPETSESNSSLHAVNIHSDISQITWGELHPALAKKAIPTILEINETTVSIRLDYIVNARDGAGHIEYYAVEEFYRMRKAQDQVVLLDFEREANQCFDGTLPVLTETGLNLGITGKDVRYQINDAADIAVFVQSGEIWEYNRAANKASRVFSFRTTTHDDGRCENQEYGLSISSVSEEGTVVFIVYGHMNTGIHEGENGIALFRYDQEDNTTKELLFIPSDQGFEYLDRSLSRLAYVNESEQCFLCYGDSIRSVQLSDLASFSIQESLDWETFAVSDSQTLVAWTETTEDGKTIVSELNLNSGDTLQIDAPEGEQIRSLGFMGEDLVYGLFRSKDSYSDETGAVIEPMYRVCLMDEQGEIVKDFREAGVLIRNVERDDSMLNLNCFRMTQEGIEQLPSEHIVHYETEREENVTVKLIVEERKGTEVCLNFTVNGRMNNLLTLYTRYLTNDIAPRAELDPPAKNKAFIVYARGGLCGMYEKVNEAISAADDLAGIVLNDQQQYVWERGNFKESVTLDPALLPEGLLDAPIEESRVANAVGEGYTVWNLSECSLSSLKYQISSGYPVCAKWSSWKNVLIIGYDPFNIWVYDKASKEPKAIAFEEAEEAFDACKNVFISYHIGTIG